MGEQAPDYDPIPNEDDEGEQMLVDALIHRTREIGRLTLAPEITELPAEA